MLEISKQTCQLPMSYVETIKKSIELYKNWLTVNYSLILQFFKNHLYRTHQKTIYFWIIYKNIGK